MGEDRKGRTEKGHLSYGKFPLMVWLYLMTQKKVNLFFFKCSLRQRGIIPLVPQKPTNECVGRQGYDSR